MKSGRTIRSRFQAAIAEALEPRQLLTGTEYVVNSLADTVAADNALTLREAIQAANTNAQVNEAPAGSSTNTDIIRFDPALFASAAATMLLVRGTLGVTGDLAIEGPGTALLSIEIQTRNSIFYNAPSSTLRLSGMTVRKASVADAIQNSGSLTMSEMIVAESGRGVSNAGTLTMANVTISGNTGTGLYTGGGTATLTNVTISRNNGGGIQNGSGTAALTNVTIYGNSAGGGGGVWNAGKLALTNVTICGNSAGNGAGLFNANGTATVTNSIIAHNTVFETAVGTDFDLYGTLAAGSDYNLIGVLTPSQAASAGAHTLSGTAAVPLNPRLANPTQIQGMFVCPPLQGSPALDAGSNALAVDAEGLPLTNDQRGNARILDEHVDLGAVEGAGPSSAVTYVVNSLADTIASDGFVTLREAILAASTNQPAYEAPAGGFLETDLITFAPSLFASGPATIRGSLGWVLAEDISIQGPGTKALSIVADYTDRIFSVPRSATIRVSGLTIGGGRVAGVYNWGNVTMGDVAVSGNSGAGIYNEGGNLTLSNAIVLNNKGYGLFNTGTLAMANSSVTGNSSSGFDNRGGTLRISNVTVSGNLGIGVSNSGGQLALVNATICGNYGGGLTIGSGTVTANNTIIAQNRAIQNPDVYGSLGSGSDYNLVGILYQSQFASAGVHSLYGTSAQPLDPRLGDLSEINGLFVHPLLSSSPALNLGSDALALDANGQPMITDQIGNPRILGGRVDIGAVEGVLTSPPPVTYMVASLDDEIAADGILTFREAFLAANLNTAIGDAQPGSFTGLDRITFASGLSGTIPVSRDLLTINGKLSIEGPGADKLTFKGDGKYRVFTTGGLADLRLSGMVVTGGRGGILNCGSLTLNRVVISGNAALDYNSGGGICNQAGTVTMDEVIISDNTVGISSAGGGLYTFYGFISMRNVTVSRNTAVAPGGGIDNNHGTVTMSDVTVTNNRGSSGGGLCNVGTLTMANTIVAGNTASGLPAWGGGLYNEGKLTIANSIVTGNIASGTQSRGGGLYRSGTAAKITNSIIAQNSAPTDPDIYASLASGSDYNLIGLVDTQWRASAGAHTISGSVDAPADARLGVLTEINGRFVIPLLPGSPALNAGSNALAVDASGNPLLTDAAGQPRIAGGTVDIGAFEYQPQPLTISGTEAKDTIELTSDDQSFSYRINSTPALTMPRSLVTALRIDAQGGDELSIDLDLQATDLLIQSDPASRDQLLASISQAIASRSLRTSQADDLHGLAAILNQDAQGKPLHDTFAGTSADESSILVKLTWNGDADLNGLLDGSDYFFIDKGYLSRNLPNPLSGYRNGDFNYDGAIDGSDYFLIDKAFLSTRSLAPAAMFQTSQRPPSDRSPLAAHQSPAAAASRPRRATRRPSCVFGRKNDNQIP